MATITKRPGRNGEPSYRVRIRLHGTLRTATFPSLDAARRWVKSTEAAIVEGRHAVVPARKVTLAALIEPGQAHLDYPVKTWIR